jgi:ABC-type uncharacterized transport system substrate-binding protein
LVWATLIVLANTRRNWSHSRRTRYSPVAVSAVAALQQVTVTLPIVFANALDPVGEGYVASLAPPGGNATLFDVGKICSTIAA